MNEQLFFDTIRPIFGGHLKQSQVDGINKILEYIPLDGVTDFRNIAYIMATTAHETAFTMQPIEEYGKGKGHSYGAINAETGYGYWGRGYIQLTHDYNYKKAGEKLNLPLYENPELVMHPEIATGIMVQGMNEGWFTGKKLSDYITDTKTDYYNSRRIINGLDKAKTIAGYATTFQKAFEQAYA